jgi:hypothetical protein
MPVNAVNSIPEYGIRAGPGIRSREGHQEMPNLPVRHAPIPLCHFPIPSEAV